MSRFISHCIRFVHNFLSSNPLSQMQILSSSNSLAFVISKFTDDAKSLVDNIKASISGGDENFGLGNVSLQNVLALVQESYKHLPDFGYKEVLLLTNSFVTQDPGEIDPILSELTSSRMVVNVVHLSAEVYIFKKVAQETKGNYHVALNERDFVEIIESYCNSNSIALEDISQGDPKRLVPVGFPTLHSTPLNCEYLTECPRCHYKMEQTMFPTTCHICSLLLLKGIHQSKWKGVFQTVSPFVEEGSNFDGECFGCGTHLRNSSSLRCPKCGQMFCHECDVFVHETVKRCPGC